MMWLYTQLSTAIHKLCTTESRRNQQQQHEFRVSVHISTAPTTTTSFLSSSSNRRVGPSPRHESPTVGDQLSAAVPYQST